MNCADEITVSEFVMLINITLQDVLSGKDDGLPGKMFEMGVVMIKIHVNLLFYEYSRIK